MASAPSSFRPLTSCRMCQRSMSTSAVVRVKRPQKPFVAPLATIDAWGRRISPSAESWDDERAAKAEVARRNLLDTLAENKGKSTLEKYGSKNGYGLKLSRSKNNGGGGNVGHLAHERTSAGAGERTRRRATGGGGFGMRSRDQDDNWKTPIGARGRGKKRFQSAEEKYLEQARLLNPSAFVGSKDKDNVQKNKTNNVSYNNPSFRSGSDEDVESRYGRNSSSDDRTTFSRSTAPHLHNNKVPLRFGPWANSEKSYNNNHSRVRDDEQPIQRKSFGLSSSMSQRTNINDLSTTPDHASSTESRSPSSTSPSPSPSANHWQPTKKLTYSAMAGLKALHAIEPETYTRQVLSKRFGISVEAVSRIIKSKFRNGQTAKFDSLPSSNDGTGASARVEWNLGEETGLDVQNVKPTLKGTKWDRDPGTSDNVSPVPAIMRAYQARRS